MRKFIIGLITLLLSSYTLSISAVTASSSQVKISEIDCNAEWFEIVNNGPLSINVRNFEINVVETDGTVLQDSFTLPAAKILPGKFKVYSEVELGFGIGCGDESLILQDSTSKEIDRVAIPNLLEDVTWSRFGTSWAGGSPTQNLANQSLAPGTPIDEAAWIFDQMQSFRINLNIDADYLDPNNPDGLVQQPKEYVPATFRFRDAQDVLLPVGGALEVGVRTKGSVGSTAGGQVNISNGKIGLKVKFNWSVPGQEFLGLKRLTLNNMMQDPTMVRDVLSYQLFTDMGLVSPRTGFARVYINSGSGFDYTGLYLNLESYDEIMMARWRTSMQHMYDAMWSPGWNNSSQSCTGQWYAPEIRVDDYRCNFEVDRGDPTNVDDIGLLADALDDQDTLSADAKKIISVSQVGKFFAVEKYISHWDGQSGSPEWTPNNYRLFTNKNGKVELLPWGTDGTWYRFENGNQWAPSGQVDGYEPFYSAQSKLFMQCLADDLCNSEYLKALQTISQIAQYQQYANDLFVAHTSARAADTLRWSDEASSAWELSKTIEFINNRDEMALDYVREVATGAIRWTPVNRVISVGSALKAIHLNAYSDVLGTFKYSKKLGTKLKKGTYFIKATFTPNNLVDWDVQEKIIKFTVK
ncbi:MAG: hypothetical protein RJA41_606 [Actinomycetota bacterium]